MNTTAVTTISFDSTQPLTLEEKIGQLLMVNFCGEIVNDDAKALIQDVHVGGIIYYAWANGLTTVGQVKNLSCQLQELAKTTKAAIPLLIATDQEGGVVTRLKPDFDDQTAQKQFTVFPGNRAIAETRDVQLASDSAFAIGQELADVGITLNLAPVVDVNCNPHNPVIGLRSFGSTPDTVISFAKAALVGYKNAGVLSTLKHFPGHGDVTVDSHHDLPTIYKSQEELEETELKPFAALANQADAIMTAHLLIPAFDKEKCSTLSEKTLNYLRNTIGFSGVIISDSLVMQGVLKQTNGSVSEAAIQALHAGCDILLLGGKEVSVSGVRQVHKAILSAVKNERLQESHIDKAAQRILKMKSRMLPAATNVPKELFSQHKDLAKKIAKMAVRCERKTDLEISLKQSIVIAPKQLSEAIQNSSFATARKSCFFETLNPNLTVIEQLKNESGTAMAKTIIVFAYNAKSFPLQKTLIDTLILTGKPLVLVVTGSPEDAELFPKSALTFTTFSPTSPALDEVAELLS